MIQGIVLFLATVFLLTNLLIDLSYAHIDPRIRYS
jgi:peptide/nickel transport system permease protein